MHQPTLDITPVRMLKTGSTRLRSWVRDICGKDIRSFRHQPAHRLEGTGMRVGVIRDPWSWYGSLFAYLSSSSVADNNSMTDYMGSDVYNFQNFVTGASRTNEASPIGNAKYPLTLHTDITPEEDAVLRKARKTLWSSAIDFWFRTPNGEWAVDVLLDFHRLQEGFEAITGQEVPESARSRMNTSADLYKPRISKNHVEAWNDELKALPAQADAEYINLFGLRFYEQTTYETPFIILTGLT